MFELRDDAIAETRCRDDASSLGQKPVVADWLAEAKGFPCRMLPKVTYSDVENKKNGDVSLNALTSTDDSARARRPTRSMIAEIAGGQLIQ